MKKARTRRQAIPLPVIGALIAGVILGTLIISPASAHIGTTPWHLWTQHLLSYAKGVFFTKGETYSRAQADARYPFKGSLSSAGSINNSANPLHWTKLKGVPAGIADGTDANSGGDVTSVAPGQGLSGGGLSGALTLSIDFGTGPGQVAEGNSVYSKAQSDSRYDASMCKLAAALPYTYPAAWCDRSYSAAVDTNNDVGMFSSIAIGADGLPVISYRDDTSRDLRITHCGNAACSSGNVSTTVDLGIDYGFDTSIAIGADGFPIISSKDISSGALHVIHCGNATCTSGNATNSVDWDGDVGAYSSIAIGSDGLPIISFSDATNLDMRVTHCGDAACSAGNITTAVDTDGNVGWHTSLAIGTDGLPIIAHYGVTGGELRVTHCGNAECSSGNTTAAIDTGDTVGVHPSIAIGTDGLPVISHQDETNGDLLVTHCGDAGCTAGNTTTSVDTANNVGWYTSIAIGTDGLPIVSHMDASSYDLRVTRCGNAACTSGNISRSVETANKVGYFSSIAIGSDGLPIISHYDDTTWDLRILHGKLD